MSKTETELHAQALAEGYTDETCPKCGTMLLAHHHFIRCDAKPCPMSNGKTLLEMLSEVSEVRAALSASSGSGK